MMWFVHSLDVFGFKPFLYVKGKKYYTTFYGFIVSFICFASILSISLYFLVQMFDKSNFSSVFSTINPEIPLSINFTNDKFYFGIALEDPITYDFVLDESIYHLEASYKRGVRQVDGSVKWEDHPVELEKCELNKFPKRYQSLFVKRNLNHMYCVKNFTYNIEGTFLHDVYSFLMFNFYQCKNSSLNGNKCKPIEDIEYYLNGTFAAIEFTDISIDPTNYTEPDTAIIGEGYSTVSNKSYREMHVFLKSVKIKKDNGYVFSFFTEKNYIQLDFVKDMNTITPKEEFCSITLKISNTVDVYTLRYVKLQTTIANIGGFIKVITVIGTILTFFYSKTKYEIDLVNKIFFIAQRKNYNQLIHIKQYSNNQNNGKINTSSEPIVKIML